MFIKITLVQFYVNAFTLLDKGEPVIIPVTNPALVAHWSLAVAAVDVQCCRRLVQAGDGAACTQFDDFIGHVPKLKSLQQVYVGHVPVLLKGETQTFVWI